MLPINLIIACEFYNKSMMGINSHHWYSPTFICRFITWVNGKPLGQVPENRLNPGVLCWRDWEIEMVETDPAAGSGFAELKLWSSVLWASFRL